jgi:RNA polymerase sigma-70 factor, ECF subfamily
VTDDKIAALIVQIAQKDRAAFAVMYGLTRDVLFGVLLRILRDRLDAEDALQEVYARVWLRAESFVPARGTGMTWLITIARNFAIDQRRQQQLNRIADMEIDSIADPDPGPDAYFAARLTLGQIKFCLGTLDPVHANALADAYLNGKSYDELSRHYGVPLNTMRTWLRRGLIKLRDCMAS